MLTMVTMATFAPPTPGTAARIRQVLLWHGIAGAHGPQCDAQIGALAPEQAALLAEQCDGLSPAARVTRLLAATLRSIGYCSRVDARLAAQLTAGDREALLLALHYVQFGPVMHARLACPHCAAALELDLEVEELLLPPCAQPDTLEWPAQDSQAGAVRLRLRLPTGADLERAAAAAAQDPEGAARALLAACVQSAENERGADVALSPSLLEAVADAIAAGDPQAEIALVMDCPQCATRFEALFDTARFLFDQYDALVRSFWRDVHDIASRYHWSEADIVALPVGRRRRYLQMIRTETGP
jgi:hypothetical protein